MDLQTFLIGATIFLGVSTFLVPITHRLGLGSVLGYLFAGILIGPVLGLVKDTVTLQHFGEFGVVLMLFIVGLELKPSMLWNLKVPILGTGGAQVIITAGLITSIAILFGQPWQYAVAIGLILALSSTAIVLQVLNEYGLTRTSGGQSIFSVLLFQDIAIIPMLALMPLLATLPAQPMLSSAAEEHETIALHLSP
ncbi:MAG: cation:proton antiporter, partial [Parachlamydiaceae bacterium]